MMRAWHVSGGRRDLALRLLAEKPRRSVELARLIYGQMGPQQYRAVMRLVRELGCIYGEGCRWSLPIEERPMGCSEDGE